MLDADAALRVSPRPPRDSAPSGSVQTVEKTLAILEVVAERGGASAKDVSEALGYPLPTTYRLLQALVSSDYLVHLRKEKRFELGYKLDRLGASLHRQIGVPAPVRAEIARLHQAGQTAAYFAVYRGSDVVVTYVVDCPVHPRITPLRFGFHEATHATAFGKLLLAGMDEDEAARHLDRYGTPALTSSTFTDRDALAEHLAEIGRAGLAWEHEEFVPGMTCAAAGVRNGAGMLVGAVAISSPTEALTSMRAAEVERALRESANRVSRYYRSGRTSG
ncbi:IclR family transcriptional regulator [Kineococcus gynurae]|uniref:IclR family transcriptional regulator n=1 Tax=Kineococcus gynurae TaxID=452979 RepID=A0ABV5LPW5_9ACTN